MPNRTVYDVSYHYTIHEATVAAAGEATAGEVMEQPPLVLLHGFTGSGANWQPLQAEFATTRRSIAVDLLGHGQTEAPADPTRYGMAESARDLVALLAEIAPGPVDLLGYSMGGRLALFLAVTYPDLVRRLILESASPGLADPTAQQARVQSDEALADKIEAEGIPPFVAHWEQLSLFASQRSLPAETRQRLREQRLRNREQGLANSLRGMGTGIQPALWDALPRVALPTLLITGALDQKFCAIATAMRSRLPAAKHVTVPHAGHTVHLEQPAIFQQTISNFLHSSASVDIP